MVIRRFEKKIEEALKALKSFEPKDGYYVAFSGGKDSIVIYDLVKRAGVKYDVHHHVTTIDPPELMRFIKKEYPEVERVKPKLSMFELVEKKGSLPTRIGRFCCEHLKEGGGGDRIVVLGIRSEESNSRSDRKSFEWIGNQNKLAFNLIVDWTEKDVWEYIDSNKLKYPECYDTGSTRIGCIGCPLIAGKRMKKEFAQYPHIKKGYIKAIQKALDKGKFRGFNGSTAEEIFNWWTSGLRVKDYLQTLKQEAIDFGI